MKKLMAICLLCLCSNANAALITTDFVDFTNFTNSYSHSSVASVTSSFDDNPYIDFIIKGDFSNSVGEYFRFFIDGIKIADWSKTTPGLSVVDNHSTLDHTISGRVYIDELLWSAFIGDGVLNISWVTGPGVDPLALGGNDFVQYNLYAFESVSVSAPGFINIIFVIFCILVIRMRKLV